MQNKIQEVQKEVNERFLQWQKASKFPKALYCSKLFNDDGFAERGLDQLIHRSFHYFTPQHLKLSLEDFHALYKIPYGEYDLRELSNVLYMVQNLTANDLGVDIDVYLDIQSEVKKMVTEWQRIVNPKHTELQAEANDIIQKIQEEDQRKQQEAFTAELNKESRTIEMPLA